MTISKIKAAEKLIKYGLDKYYGTKLQLLECERNTILENSQELLIEHLVHIVKKKDILPTNLQISPDGFASYIFEVPSIRNKLDEIESSMKSLQDEYSEKLQLLENWVNYAIIHDNNITNAPSIPDELKPFYEIAVEQFTED